MFLSFIYFLINRLLKLLFILWYTSIYLQFYIYYVKVSLNHFHIFIEFWILPTSELSSESWIKKHGSNPYKLLGSEVIHMNIQNNSSYCIITCILVTSVSSCTGQRSGIAVAVERENEGNEFKIRSHRYEAVQNMQSS